MKTEISDMQEEFNKVHSIALQRIELAPTAEIKQVLIGQLNHIIEGFNGFVRTHGLEPNHVVEIPKKEG